MSLTKSCYLGLGGTFLKMNHKKGAFGQSKKKIPSYRVSLIECSHLFNSSRVINQLTRVEEPLCQKTTCDNNYFFKEVLILMKLWHARIVIIGLYGYLWEWEQYLSGRWVSPSSTHTHKSWVVDLPLNHLGKNRRIWKFSPVMAGKWYSQDLSPGLHKAISCVINFKPALWIWLTDMKVLHYHKIYEPAAAAQLRTLLWVVERVK